jgi:hypothetical protein
VFGARSLQAALSVEELTARYDNEPECTNTEEDAPHGDKELALFSRQGFGFNCTITITVEEDMNQPIYFYYQLHNFYQNHRRLVNLATKNLTFWCVCVCVSARACVRVCACLRMCVCVAPSEGVNVVDALTVWSYDS